MTVYVDDMAYPWKGQKWFHLMADSVEELHALAEAIGLKRAWFQNKPSGVHYDVNQTKRAAAVAAGAFSIDRMEHRDLYKEVIKQAKSQYRGRKST